MSSYYHLTFTGPNGDVLFDAEIDADLLHIVPANQMAKFLSGECTPWFEALQMNTIENEQRYKDTDAN